MKILSLGLFLTLCLLNTDFSHSEVIPLNKNFSLDNWKMFFPHQPLSTVMDKNGKGEIISKKNDIILYKFSAKHLRYQFPLYIQSFKGKIIEAYFRLPSYFLHNVFHQSLINRWGKQDQYTKKEKSAFYLWKQKDKMKIIYSGMCTIHCFPFFLSLRANPGPKGVDEWKPLIEVLSQNSHHESKLSNYSNPIN